jgi:hypothetical protein
VVRTVATLPPAGATMSEDAAETEATTSEALTFAKAASRVVYVNIVGSRKGGDFHRVAVGRVFGQSGVETAGVRLWHDRVVSASRARRSDRVQRVSEGGGIEHARGIVSIRGARNAGFDQRRHVILAGGDGTHVLFTPGAGEARMPIRLPLANGIANICCSHRKYLAQLFHCRVPISDKDDTKDVSEARGWERHGRSDAGMRTGRVQLRERDDVALAISLLGLRIRAIVELDDIGLVADRVSQQPPTERERTHRLRGGPDPETIGDGPRRQMRRVAPIQNTVEGVTVRQPRVITPCEHANTLSLIK